MADIFTSEFLLAFARGAGWTILLSLTAGTAGTVLGVLLGLGKTSDNKPARWVCTAYVNIVRGIPLLVIIFFIYFGIPLVFPDLDLSRFMTGFVALTVFAAAYIAEIARASIEAVPKGQSEAARALGLSYAQRYRYIILPQATKVAIPALISFFIGLVKDSSLVTAIGFNELMRAGALVGDLSERPIEAYLTTATIYFAICYSASLLGHSVEKRLRTDHRAPEAQPATTKRLPQLEERGAL